MMERAGPPHLDGGPFHSGWCAGTRRVHADPRDALRGCAPRPDCLKYWDSRLGGADHFVLAMHRTQEIAGSNPAGGISVMSRDMCLT